MPHTTKVGRPAVKVGYLNCNGLNVSKWKQSQALIENKIFDFLILAETWFVCKDLYTLSPYYLCESNRDNTRTTGHSNGGLLILVNRKLKPLCSITFISQASLSVSIKGLVISSIYFPPSMAVDKICEELSSLPKSQILLGVF